MGTFWDALVLRICVGLGEHYPPAVRVITRVLEGAHRRGQFDPPALNNRSLLLILLHCSAESPLGRDARAEFLRRRLNPGQLWAAYHGSVTPPFDGLFSHAYFGQPAHGALVNLILGTVYLPPLVRFLARTALVEPQVAEPFARMVLRDSLRLVGAQPTANHHVLIDLYGRILDTWPNAVRWPEPAPRWQPPATSGERVFLEVCLDHLEPGRRCLLYLSLYAGLGAETLSGLFGNLPGWDRVPWVVDALGQTWDEVLQLMT